MESGCIVYAAHGLGLFVPRVNGFQLQHTDYKCWLLLTQYYMYPRVFIQHTMMTGPDMRVVGIRHMGY